jgi:hypothetical protein
MFLTTNRVSQFDEAILSRIHLTLKYDDLNETTKEQIWQQFLNRADTSHGPAKAHHSELERLVATKFNGRQVRIHQTPSNILVLTVALLQIKNIVATAHALATTQGSPIQFEHLQRAVVINERFVCEFYSQNYVDSLYR